MQLPLEKGCEPLQCGVVQRHWMELHAACASYGVHCSIEVPPCALATMPSGTASPAAAIMSVRHCAKYQHMA